MILSIGRGRLRAATFGATVIRADGSRIPLGTVAYSADWMPNLLQRAVDWYLANKVKRLLRSK